MNCLPNLTLVCGRFEELALAVLYVVEQECVVARVYSPPTYTPPPLYITPFVQYSATVVDIWGCSFMLQVVTFALFKIIIAPYT